MLRRPQCLQRRKGTQGTASGFKHLEEKMNKSHRHRPNQREEKTVPRAEDRKQTKKTMRTGSKVRKTELEDKWRLDGSAF